MSYEDAVEEGQEVEGYVDTSSDDVFKTEEWAPPPTIPDAHKGVITGVTLETFESGASAMKVSLHSHDVPTLDTEFLVFLPKEFVKNVAVKKADLPEVDYGKGDPRNDKQQTQFNMSVANSDGTSTLQMLRKLCLNDPDNEDSGFQPGRAQKELGLPNPKADINVFVENHSKQLSNLDVVFLRRPDTGDGVDPRFKGKLRVRNILPLAAADDVKRVKAYNKTTKKGYIRQWEQQG